MKNNRLLWVSSIVVFIIVSSYFTIKNLNTINHGNNGTFFTLLSKLESHFNPISLKDQPVYDLRVILSKSRTRWDSNPILFPNIKNMDIKTASNQLPVRVYTPELDNNLPLIIYIHGGGFISGNIDEYDNICRRLSKNSNAIVVSVTYRLAPENPFPAGLNDVYNVLQWVYKNAKSINGDSSRICIAGDSAGGNLAAAVSLMARDKAGPPISSVVLIYPSTNIYKLNTKSWSYFDEDNLTKKTYEKFISLYTPRLEDRKSEYASPLLCKNFKGLPDTLIVTAELDPLRDDGEIYGNKLRHAGVDVVTKRYTGAPHGFISMGNIAGESHDALKYISMYIKNKFSKK